MAAELAPGKWQLEKSDNFDEYMKAIGVELPQGLVGNEAKVKQDISVSDGVWTILTTTSHIKVELKFKVGDEFDETTIDWRKVKTIVTIDGNKLIQKQKGDIDSYIVREFSEDGFIMTLTAKDVVCKRYYKRVK